MATEKTKRRRRLRVKPAVESIVVEEAVEVEVDENDIDDSPIRKARRILKAGDAFSDDGPEEEVIKPEPVPEAGKVIFSTDPMTDVLTDLTVGHAVVITREDGERYSMRLLETNEFSVKPTLTNKEYLNTVLTEAYVNFGKMWGDMTTEERLKYAKKYKVTWNEHEDHRINMLRLTQAVREVKNISKYAPEWDTKAKRSKIRPRR